MVDNSSLIAGIDDAGRGPLIGPLIIAGVSFSEDNIEFLKRIGVKDSKKLIPSTRKRLCRIIKSIAHKIVIKEISPQLIDQAVFRVKYQGLNHLEAIFIAKIIEELRPSIVYVDSPDIIPERFKEMILKLLPNSSRYVKIICENKADLNYLVVASASILAKEYREECIIKLKRIYGDFGSGYPSDTRTIYFLKRFYRENGTLPPIVRKSWKTLKRIIK